MILLEYEAKNILRNFSVSVPHSSLISDNTELPAFPFVIKSQVPVGGRGKLGGIKIVNDQQEFTVGKSSILHTEIKGYIPKTLLAEELLDISNEWYVAFKLNTDSAHIELVAHKDGGVDIEDNNAKDFLVQEITSQNDLSILVDSIADLFGCEDKRNVLEDIILNLYRCFVESDCILLEINPLVRTRSGTIVAADCKMELDDAAYFRHPEWNFEQTKIDSNFVTLNKNGTVATIANGAGLAMATVDAVAASGLVPANFLDIGGGADEDSVLRAFREIMKYENVQAIVINIFAGITRCDEVAKAIIAAKEQIPDLPPLCIRLAGTNLDEARIILEKENVKLLPNLETCISQAKEYVTL